MAYGVFFAAVHREEVSQRTVAARGLLCTAFAWKGMGSSGYHKPPALAIPSYFGYIILMLSLTLASGKRFIDFKLDKILNQLLSLSRSRNLVLG